MADQNTTQGPASTITPSHNTPSQGNISTMQSAAAFQGKPGDYSLISTMQSAAAFQGKPGDYSLTLALKFETLYAKYTDLVTTSPGIQEERDGTSSFILVGDQPNNRLEIVKQVRTLVTNRFSTSSILQVIGDSAHQSYSTSGVQAAVALLVQYARGSIVEFGLTAGEMDSGSAVEQYLSSMTEGPPAVIANVTGAQIEALRIDGYRAPEAVSTFVMLTNATRAEPNTTYYGDDMWLSDHIQEAAMGDQMLCLEGGKQSFLQAATALCRSVPVIACSNLRSATAESKFSAARLLLEVQKGLFMNQQGRLSSNVQLELSRLGKSTTDLETALRQIYSVYSSDFTRLRSLIIVRDGQQAAYSGSGTSTRPQSQRPSVQASCSSQY